MVFLFYLLLLQAVQHSAPQCHCNSRQEEVRWGNGSISTDSSKSGNHKSTELLVLRKITAKQRYPDSFRCHKIADLPLHMTFLFGLSMAQAIVVEKAQ